MGKRYNHGGNLEICWQAAREYLGDDFVEKFRDEALEGNKKLS